MVLVLEMRCIAHKANAKGLCLEAEHQRWQLGSAQLSTCSPTTLASPHSNLLNIQLRRLGYIVAFLKARRNVGLPYGLLADRKQ